MNELEIFAKRLRTARADAMLNYNELAKKAGTSDATICRIENGKRCPNLMIAARLAKALNVSLDWLCGLDDAI